MSPVFSARLGGPGRRFLLALLAALSLAFSGCAALRSPMSEAAAEMPQPAAKPVDPWERFNRAVFSFNDSLDRRLLIPLATTYKLVVPAAVSQTFENVVSNVFDAWSAVNLLLQGKPKLALDAGMRFGVNSVFGLGGALDVAGEMGLERHPEDFGQTLGVWGIPSGPYLVLPLLGPSTVRDGLALPLDRATSLSSLASGTASQFSLGLIELVHTRATLLNASSVLNQVALDRYSFVRDSFLARRKNLVFDGNPPPEPEDLEDEPKPKAGLPPKAP